MPDQLPDQSLTGRRVVVTGGAQGIGRAVTERLVALGADVVIGDVQAEVAEQTAAATGTTACRVDVSDRASFAAFLDSAVGSLGGLDVLVNNAGIMPLGSFLDEDDDLTQRTVAVNLQGVLTGTKLAGRLFRQQGHGHVVNIASSLGTLASPQAATYCATKYAVVGLGHSLRQEWRGTGVHLSSILPGFVRTDLIAGMHAPRLMERFLMVGPEQVADAAARTIQRGRSDTVFVPKAVGAGSRFNNNLPIAVRDFLFRTSGGERVTTDIDRGERAAYERRITER